MSKQYDVIVIGLGGMGSAAACQLAARGQRVLGLERHTPAHDLGSSHGESRIIRQAYLEGTEYVPLVLRAYELWRQLERDSGADLLQITGGLMIGPPTSQTIQGSAASARQYDLPHEMLDTAAIRRRFPALTPTADTVALYEPHAGVVRPEDAVRAHLAQAARHGATLQFEEPVERWQADPGGEGVRVTTARGSYSAARLVIAPGGWAPALLADLGLPLVVERQVQYWFAPRGGIAPFLPDRFPIYIWELADATVFYGFPALHGPAGGVKVGQHRVPGPCTPETVDRTIHPAEIAAMRDYLRDHLPALDSDCIAAKTCLYTCTPDTHFVIDRHPAHPQVTIACGFSGHGFKFASVVGEILADLSTTGVTRHPLDLFSARRLLG